MTRARAVQRENMLEFSDGLQAWLRGEETPESMAAGVSVAILLECARQILVK